MASSLLFSRRLGPIFVAMALSAFNDNFYKNALVILITYVLAASLALSAEQLINFATACFIVPYFLFSGFAGMLADKYPKHQLMRILKITELVLVILAGAALMYQHVWALLAILFLLGTQSSFFSPVKYALLPELLTEKQLLKGNGIVEAGTFVSILIGSSLGGLLILRPHGSLLVVSILVVAAIIGVIAAWYVPERKAAVPTLTIPWNPFAGIMSLIRSVMSHRAVLLPIIGISWFWAIGATYLTQLAVFTKDVVGADEKVVTLFTALFSIGIAAGALACPYLSQQGKRHLAPHALTGLALFSLDLVWVGYHSVAGTELMHITAFLSSGDFAHYRVMIDLFMIAFCGGVFTIPLYTKLQTESGVENCARAVASNNVINSLFMASAAGIAAGLYGLQWNVCDVLLAFSLANIPVIALLWKRSGS